MRHCGGRPDTAVTGVNRPACRLTANRAVGSLALALLAFDEAMERDKGSLAATRASRPRAFATSKGRRLHNRALANNLNKCWTVGLAGATIGTGAGFRTENRHETFYKIQ